MSRHFHNVYTPCWEGAYGAIGDAYLFALTGDSSLFRFHILQHDVRRMCAGTWVDDVAWVCLAELKWWELTGKGNMNLVLHAMRRYKEVREQGRLSTHEGFWTWYNWPPGASVGERIFTNSNMNQMATVACALFQAKGDRQYLNDWAAAFAAGNPFPVGEGEIDPFSFTGPRLSKPLVIAVQGRCYTWGWELLLNTDLRVAARDTRLAMLEVRRGFYACGGATLRLPREIGWGNAQRYLLTGDELGAEEAYRLGLVQQLCAPGEQLDAAIALAQRVAKAAPLGVQGSLR